MLLGFGLIFSQLEPDIAYKSVAYKKACISERKSLTLDVRQGPIYACASLSIAKSNVII